MEAAEVNLNDESGELSTSREMPMGDQQREASQATH